ncbi:MAG: hypothetical protein WC804_16720 [Sphingomonas sp.]|uniref:hypothetical protein n=1 Tax=Sphingomonas sp. TaxID=28214 RepID=UPI0035692520
MYDLLNHTHYLAGPPAQDRPARAIRIADIDDVDRAITTITTIEIRDEPSRRTA